MWLIRARQRLVAAYIHLSDSLINHNNYSSKTNTGIVVECKMKVAETWVAPNGNMCKSVLVIISHFIIAGRNFL